MDSKLFYEYIHEIEENLASGKATEPSHYPALKKLLEGIGDGIKATQNPKKIECGAPDFIVAKNNLILGYIEAKNVGENLDAVENSEQLIRYRAALPNLILTNFIEFRWFINGRQERKAGLGQIEKATKIIRDKAGIDEVAQLVEDFLKCQQEGLGTPQELAQSMARLAHRIGEGAEEALSRKLASLLLTSLYKAFSDTLIPDLPIAQFADMYAQTIAYGLFAARCEAKGGQEFTRYNAAGLIPKTNPFLRELFYQIAGPKLDDEPYRWAVDELVQLLKLAEMDKILKGFGKSTATDDPVVYFYESFLKEYDPETREMRGVYYTPLPVVSYIVRSIDYLLKKTFQRPLGLADQNIYILDPAAGTATFLYAVVNEIHEAMAKQGQQGMWNDYVAERLLPRLFGFELLMAPYAVAHLKLGLQLRDTGYAFRPEPRLGIYLTNTLEEAIKKSEMLLGQFIVKEANEAAEIKKDKPIMVVLGNPPYSGHSANRGPWARQLVETYKTVDGKPLGERNPKWLQDDYVKFLRFGQWRIERTGEGILGFITNHAYLDNPTFRGMRQSLVNSFSHIYILDLHGSARKREVVPDGSPDENVFDIQQGVAIGLFVKQKDKAGPAKVHHAHLWGLREGKYQALSGTDIALTEWRELAPSSPFYFFVPVEEKYKDEYEKGWRVTDIFPVNSVGIVTSRDEFVLDFEESNLKTKIELFRDNKLMDTEITERFALKEKKGWMLSEARKRIQKDKDWQGKFAKCLYRPFDIRHIFYHNAVIERPRPEVMRHMLAGGNLALHLCRQTVSEAWRHVLATNRITDDCYVSNITRERGYTFPLYLYPQAEAPEGQAHQETVRRPNLNPAFIAEVEKRLGVRSPVVERGHGGEVITPEDIFNYAYAVFHSPTYRRRYGEFLKIDFPRLPLTSDKGLFATLANKGAELVGLHLMESPVLLSFVTQYPVAGSNLVEKVAYGDLDKRVYINKDQYFEGVSKEVWEFHIGGYQVCEKWLKDRKGRKLSLEEREHYQRIVVAIQDTIRIMKEIDSLIPQWPLE